MAPDPSDRTNRQVLVVALLVGLAVRGAILSQTTHLGTPIMDEQQYSQIARNIDAGNGFAWGPGAPTSIRPPLYPAMLAGAWKALGSENLQAIRALQILMSLATAALVYLIGLRAFGAATATWAAAAVWLYPSFIFYDFLILTETLFTLWLAAFVLATIRLVQSPKALFAVACGASLGLAALTRSVLWPLPLLLCPGLLFMMRVPVARRLALAALVLVAYAAVVGPWAVRNTRLQHVTEIVDTMSGMNLRMGNYEYTPDDRMWDAVALGGEKSWVYGIDKDFPGEPITEGQKDKWAQRKAIEYMRAHPAVTVRRSLIKFADFWGLEREFVAGVQKGLYAPPTWFEVVAGAAIVAAYALIVLAGAAGIWLARPLDWRIHAVLLVPVVLIMGGHTIVFGHSRYHLPLMPIFALYGAALWVKRGRALRVSAQPLRLAALASVAVLLAIWVRQVVVTDLDRILSLVRHAG